MEKNKQRKQLSAIQGEKPSSLWAVQTNWIGCIKANTMSKEKAEKKEKEEGQV